MEAMGGAFDPGPAPSPTGPTSRATPRILFVEGDARLRSIVAGTLASEGLMVTEAGDAADALALLQHTAVDLVLCSRDLPGVNGLELCRLVHLILGEEVPVVIGTGASARDRIEALKAGADACMSRPLALDELLLTIRTQVRKADKLRQAVSREREEVLAGRIEEFSPAEILQMLDLRGCGEMVAGFHADDGREGRVWLRDHIVVHAECDGVSGHKAFSTLLGLQTGRFFIEHGAFEGAPSIEAKLDQTLLACLVKLDEERALERHLELRAMDATTETISYRVRHDGMAETRRFLPPVDSFLDGEPERATMAE